MRAIQKAWRAYDKARDQSHSWRWRVLGPLVDVSIGPKTRIARGAVLSTQLGGGIRIGRKCVVESGARLLTYGGSITLGDYCSVNANVLIYGHGGVRIGNDVRIAAGTIIIPANHIFTDPQMPIRRQGETRRGIVIEDDVWIAAGCVILDGVTVARGCVIAAGAVVTRPTAPLGVYAGTPARRLRDRGSR